MPILSFGDKLSLLRKKKRTSQKKLAQLLHILQGIDHLPEKERNRLKNPIKSYLVEHGAYTHV